MRRLVETLGRGSIQRRHDPILFKDKPYCPVKIVLTFSLACKTILLAEHALDIGSQQNENYYMILG